MENNTPSSFSFPFHHPNSSSSSSSWGGGGGGMSFQSLLTTNFDDKTLLPLLGYSPPTTTTYDFMPIPHPPSHYNNYNNNNYYNNNNHLSFNQLPLLCSLDNDNVVQYNSNHLAPAATDSSSSSSSSSRKRQRLKSLSPDIHRLSVAQQRSHKFRENINYLQSLLPPASPNNNNSKKKMDMATVLEEAYKYVKFLQAQLRILKAMPQFSDHVLSSSRNVVDVFGGGGLGRLSRNQLLQVLVNSPAAQSIMYSNGLCVFSAEQLPWLKHIIAAFFAAYS